MSDRERTNREAWLDEENRIVSFHEISDSRSISAASPGATKGVSRLTSSLLLHMVEVLNPAVFDNIHAELHKLFDVVAERVRVGGDVIFFQIGRYMIYFRYLVDIALLIFYCIYNHTVVHYYAKEMVLEFMIWEGEAIMNDLNYKESSLCGARSCVGKMVPEPYGG